MTWRVSEGIAIYGNITSRRAMGLSSSSTRATECVWVRTRRIGLCSFHDGICDESNFFHWLFSETSLDLIYLLVAFRGNVSECLTWKISISLFRIASLNCLFFQLLWKTNWICWFSIPTSSAAGYRYFSSPTKWTVSMLFRLWKLQPVWIWRSWKISRGRFVPRTRWRARVFKTAFNG